MTIPLAKTMSPETKPLRDHRPANPLSRVKFLQDWIPTDAGMTAAEAINRRHFCAGGNPVSSEQKSIE